MKQKKQPKAPPARSAPRPPPPTVVPTTSLGFAPCSATCPAVTGKPHGSIRYCPMAEHKRHRAFETGPHREAGSMRRAASGEWLVFDWQSNKWIPREAGNLDQVPTHPDQTDCCLNFQCCSDGSP